MVKPAFGEEEVQWSGVRAWSRAILATPMRAFSTASASLEGLSSRVRAM